MQATLSTTASGKHFRTGTLTAGLTALAHVSLEHVSLESAVRQNHNMLSEGAGLAHDAGNLLGALGLYCELLAMPGVLREEHRHYAEELQLLSGRSRVLIDRLLNTRLLHPVATKPGRRNAVAAVYPQVELVSVPEVIEGCRGLLNAVARRAIEVAYGAGAMLPVAVPRESIERVLVNLTKNAAEASTPEGAITLRVTSRRDGAEPERIVLTVEDQGCGMSSAAVKVLLGEAPGRVPSAGPRNGLRGIGFRVVRELVGASGGRLRMWSECGSAAAATGTTVEIAWMVAAGRAAGVDAALEGGYVPNPMMERRELMLLAKQGMGGRAKAGRASC